MSLIKTFRGDTNTIVLNFKTGGVAIDITGWVVYLTVKINQSDTDDDAVIKKDVSSHAQPALGQAVVTLTPDDTKDLDGSYYYDIQVKRGEGDVFTVVKDIFLVDGDITRRI